MALAFVDGEWEGRGEVGPVCDSGRLQQRDYVLKGEAGPYKVPTLRPGLCVLQALHGGPSPEPGLELAGGGCAGADRSLLPQPPPPADAAEPEHL